jgi:hypothetical protein
VSVLVRFAAASLTAEQYEESIGVEPGEPELLEVHHLITP